MRRAIVLTCGLLVVPTVVFSQTGSLRVSVPSPTAASLGKFGDIPVSLYTGVPEISVPLFTAKGKTLSLPVVLRYHAGGLRVEEIGGWVGMGWTLEAGGVITRTVRGTHDEKADGYYYTGTAFYSPGNWPTPTTTLLDNIQVGSVDGEPDQFFYNFAGHSGEFVMGPTNADPNAPREVRTIPYEDWRITPTIAGNSIESFVVITEDGTRYTFNVPETHTDWSDGARFDVYGRPFRSTWYLSEIKSPGGDVITLQYTSFAAGHEMGEYQEQFDGLGGNPPCRSNQSPTKTKYDIVGQRLTSITAAGHVIAFTTSLRDDALGRPNSFTAGAKQEPKLDLMTVSTPDGVLLRRLTFEYDYSIGGRLTLRNVYEEDSSATRLPPYSFTYNTTGFPSRTSYAQDHWGFYNGQNNNSSLIPPGTNPLNGGFLPGANRIPDSAAMQAGALTRITYPTGGFNNFLYETNDYGRIADGSAMLDYVPRSNSVTSFNGPQTITFTVSGPVPVNATVGTGLPPWTDPPPACANGDPVNPCPFVQLTGGNLGVRKYYGVSSTQITLDPGTYQLTADNAGNPVTISGNVSWQELQPALRKPAGGLRIAEVQTGDAMGNVTVQKYKYTQASNVSDPTRSSGVINSEPKYDYAFQSGGTNWCQYYSRSSMSRMPLGGGPIVGYSEVWVWHGANGEFGKTIHTMATTTYDPVPAGHWPYLRRTSNEWRSGQELSAQELNAAGQIQRRTGSTYAFPVPAQTTRQFRGISTSVYSGSGGGGLITWNSFEVLSAWRFQDSEQTTVFDETGANGLATTRSFAYENPAHAQLTTLTETNSDGTQRVTHMKYPSDYASGSGNPEAAALSTMQSDSVHIHNAVIERWVIERAGGVDKVVRGEITTYRQFLTGQFLPYQRFVLNSPSPIQ